MTQSFVIQPGGRLGGRLRVPGDKSISHRALMLGAVAEGLTEVSGFLSGADCLATLAALASMGIRIDRPEPTSLLIHGQGLHGLQAPPDPLDMGNSGTAMRLFAGLLAGQQFDSVLIGDASLTRRPMQRVAEPLRAMGARIETRHGNPPLRISGGAPLQGIDFDMPVASAQVKSAVLLAGLYAQGRSRINEPAVTRDHTERMLAQFGVLVERHGSTAVLAGGQCLRATQVAVPGDLSSAAFFMLAASVAAGSELVIENVGLNPTRTGVLRILELMGADFDIARCTPVPGIEPVGTVTFRSTRLHGIDVPPELVPLAIDEFPVLFVAAALASGVTRISGAAELRHKESDRIAVMANGLRTLGVSVEERPDGAIITGGTLGSGCIESHGDHRVAMAFAVGAAAAAGPIEINDTVNVATSFPGFVSLAQDAGLQIETRE